MKTGVLEAPPVGAAPVNPDYIVPNADKIGLFRNVPQERARLAIHRRISQILSDIGREMMVDDRFSSEPMPRLEAVMRAVYDMALAGDKWCINFIADRTEGRPTQSVVVNQIHGDIRDVPTSELLASRDAEALDKLVEARARALIASGAVGQETPHRTE